MLLFLEHPFQAKQCERWPYITGNRFTALTRITGLGGGASDTLTNLRQHLVLFGDSECSCPLDKVYALLGITRNKAAAVPIRPRYERTLAALLIQTSPYFAPKKCMPSAKLQDSVTLARLLLTFCKLVPNLRDYAMTLRGIYCGARPSSGKENELDLPAPSSAKAGDYLVLLGGYPVSQMALAKKFGGTMEILGNVIRNCNDTPGKGVWVHVRPDHTARMALDSTWESLRICSTLDGLLAFVCVRQAFNDREGAQLVLSLQVCSRRWSSLLKPPIPISAASDHTRPIGFSFHKRKLRKVRRSTASALLISIAWSSAGRPKQYELS